MNMKKVFSFLFLGVASVGLQASDVFLEVEGHSKVEFSSGSGYVAVDESREQMKRLLQKIKSQKSGVITEEIEGIVLPLIRDYQNSPDYHRENYRDIPFGSFSNVLRVKTLKILDELVEPYLRKTITKTQGTDGEINARYLLDEISVAKNRDTMTLNQAQNIIPRLLLSMSVLSEDERVVMEAAVGSTVYRNFFEKDLWKNPDAYQACLDQFEKTYKNPFRGNSGNTPFWFSGSEEEKQSWINEQELWIDQKINQHNPIVPFMVPDARFFHTALVCALKLYNLDPVSLPGVSKAGTAAHGVDDLSLFGLCFHDYVHSLVTNRDNVYGAALFDALASAYYAGKDINQFREAYMPVFMNHHKTIEALFRNVLEQHVDGMVNAEKNTDMVKKNTLSESLAGLFLALNEHMGWNRGVYETSSPHKILDVFTAAAKNHLELPDSWVNPQDILETSPIDGSTGLTDPEIISRAIENSWINPEGASDFSVDRNSRFIRIKANKAYGLMESIDIPTLYHKVLNSQDNITLFKYAGTDISAFETTPKTREESLTHLDGIYKLLIRSLDGFCATSQEFLGTSLSAENPEQTVGSFYEDKLYGFIDAEISLNPDWEESFPENRTDVDNQNMNMIFDLVGFKNGLILQGIQNTSNKINNFFEYSLLNSNKEFDYDKIYNYHRELIEKNNQLIAKQEKNLETLSALIHKTTE